jgi:hypothetical protein
MVADGEDVGPVFALVGLADAGGPATVVTFWSSSFDERSSIHVPRPTSMISSTTPMTTGRIAPPGGGDDDGLGM